MTRDCPGPHTLCVLLLLQGRLVLQLVLEQLANLVDLGQGDAPDVPLVGVVADVVLVVALRGVEHIQRLQLRRDGLGKEVRIVQVLYERPGEGLLLIGLNSVALLGLIGSCVAMAKGWPAESDTGAEIEEPAAMRVDGGTAE